ncbi:MAG: hypothetical protein QF926_16300 [Alphaproteobacteria bacterium]|jgi:hypothetical protein|nr:hypothetical protein [Alphaproteobacteria bacterium]MDP6518165.1 hypothetical protein [Alphaproteobacteria bacterium]|tara:strand:+ start:196 stop:339 length:144 start_codon:yes stop_codon:yes gene_type:complete
MTVLETTVESASETFATDRSEMFDLIAEVRAAEQRRPGPDSFGIARM